MASSIGFGSNRELVFQIELVRVVVGMSYIDEIASQGGFDALVSSDDTSLAMQGGVSAAIRRAAGDVVQEEAARLLPVRLGDVVVTSAGRLPVRYIFHAVTLDLHRGIQPTDLTIRSIGRTLFRRSEDLGVRRIAMPAIGTGAAGFSAKRSARLILESLVEHASQPTNLREVVLCLPDEETRQALHSELKAVLHLDLLGGMPFATGASDSLETSELKLLAPHPRSALRRRMRRAIRRWWSREPETETDGTDVAIETPGRQFLDWMEERANAHQATRISHPLESRAGRAVLNNRYVLLEEIGRGGMGIVYLAWDLVLRQTVAIKTLRPGASISPQHIDVLRHEAALQMRLAHEGIVRLFHFEPASSETGPYLIMEYVPWPTAERWIADAGSGGLPPRAVLHLGARLCAALTSAHDAGVLHLDIKPSNVFVDPAGEQPKLADFGIAVSLGPKQSGFLVTRLVGTPQYMAPEQLMRGAKVGPWTDVYLLAGTLWELITGHTPAQQVDDCAEPVTAAALAVLRRGLAESVDERPRNATIFGSLLAGALEGQSGA